MSSAEPTTDGLARIRPPQQDRSRRAQAKALDAFESLLAHRPLARVSMHDVAAEAGLSVTSVYARFDGKQALVLALHERVVAQGRELLDSMLDAQAAADASVEADVAELIDGLVGFALDHAHIFRAVLLADDAETNERAAAFVRAGSERITEAVVPRIARPGGQVVEDIDFAWRSVVAVVQQTWSLDGAEPARFPLDRTALGRRLTRQFLATITTP